MEQKIRRDFVTREIDHIVIRFAGDSGDGMQLTGDRFTSQAVEAGNDIATLPNYPAEIRAPQGTVAGVSSFQLNFADHDITTPGDEVDVLVAMNPAALKANLADVRPGGLLLLDSSEFTPRNLTKAGYNSDPLTDDSLAAYQVVPIELTKLAVAATANFTIGRKAAERTKNMFALGLLNWLYSRPEEGTVRFLARMFADDLPMRDANLAALRAGNIYGESAEIFAVRYKISKFPLPRGQYRHISGNTALSYGLIAAAHRAGLQLFLGTYPITPASDILHELSRRKDRGVITFQAEDEIAGVGAALGASFGGALGVTTTSGPGLDLKQETIGLGVMTELPLVVVDVQRAGPSTGLPTKTEQADLNAAILGRHGESPVPVVAAYSPGDCFSAAYEACRIAIEYRTPVILLSDGYLGNGAEPWRVPRIAELPPIDPEFATEPNAVNAAGQPVFQPYQRDPETLARTWARPGTPGLEHRLGGLEKLQPIGTVSYDGNNHHEMVLKRAAKVAGIKVPDVEVSDPSGEARILILGWGSTWGAISAAISRIREHTPIAQAHLRHLNPLPANLGDVLHSYDRILVPELNLGQLASILRSKYLVDLETHNQVRGLPLNVNDLETRILSMISELENSTLLETEIWEA